MLVVKNLLKSFADVKAVNKVNFCLEDNGVTALLGPNGAGKTTLFRLICGYIAADSGEILINGHNIETERLAALRSFAYVPESGSLYPEMTVAEYLNFMAKIHNLSE